MPATPEWDGLIEENCPFALTTDQKSATQAVLRDMARSIPMDRLISGDVGFGKTEVALRAAFIGATCTDHGERFQVAIITPTTLLCRQHYQTL